jgi:histidinol-phosphate/aromatic aminotransferase/cobyric acid decarboxylase-like protein
MLDPRRRCAIVGRIAHKVFACPGLRIGYVVADGRPRRAIASGQPEWSVNSIALCVLPELLEATICRDGPTRSRSQRAHSCKACCVSHRLEPDPSDANYLLVRRAPAVRTHLARPGIVVRDTGSFGIARSACASQSR